MARQNGGGVCEGERMSFDEATVGVRLPLKGSVLRGRGGR